METILIIEDDLGNQENLADFLILEGYHVIVASSGEEGVKRAIAHLPDLIICNIIMPGISGLEVSRVVHQHPRTKSIKFMFLSGMGDRVSAIAGAACSDDYLLKPYTQDQLLKAIATQLNER